MIRFLDLQKNDMKDLLLAQFNSTFDHNNWFVSFQKAVEGLSEENADWKSENIEHSIKELVIHLTFWNKRSLIKFKGDEPSKMEGDNETSFENSKQLSWVLCLKDANGTFDAWKKAIAEASQEKLSAQVHQENKGDWYSLIANTNTHNAYHIGQIVFLRKLQGSWDKNNGVK